jgi:ATP-binding cassette subfamily D (ALD) protein 3
MASFSKIFDGSKSLLAFINESRERKFSSIAIIALVFLIVKLKGEHKNSKFGYLAKGLTKKKG